MINPFDKLPVIRDRKRTYHVYVRIKFRKDLPREDIKTPFDEPLHPRVGHLHQRIKVVSRQIGIVSSLSMHHPMVPICTAWSTKINIPPPDPVMPVRVR